MVSRKKKWLDWTDILDPKQTAFNFAVLGILATIVGSYLYEKFVRTRLP